MTIDLQGRVYIAGCHVACYEIPAVPNRYGRGQAVRGGGREDSWRG